MSGDKPYLYELDTEQVQPFNHNSALKYLWARHRIAQLSDYNQLQADDQRTQTITRLGLSYNLLTAHTSFIAVDTEKRNRAGNPVTVEQPLPLPQGVSNSALTMAGKVSGSMRAKAPLPRTAPVLRQEYLVDDSSADKATSAVRKTDREEDKAEPEIKEEQAITLTKVEVSEGLDEKTVRNILKENIKLFDPCRRQFAETSLPDSVKIRWVLDKTGRIIKTEFEDENAIPPRFRHCVLKSINQIQFPTPQNGKAATVTVVYGVRT